jgi:hypothetical protein
MVETAMKSGSKRLIVIWGVLLILAVMIFIGERQRSEQLGASNQRVVPWLLPAPMEKLGAIEIMVKGSMHRFEREQRAAGFTMACMMQTKQSMAIARIRKWQP